MAKYESVNLLYKCLKDARYPLSKQQLQELLECSAASVERYLTELRDTYGQQVEYQRESKGYVLVKNEADIELPSHLFTAQEINAILLVDQLINDLEPGFLKQDMQSFKQHINQIKSKFSNNINSHSKRIRMLNIGKRVNKYNNLTAITQAVLQRKKLSIHYDSRSIISKQTPSKDRLLSPQRLTHYRDNWYLDAWCHQRNALRTFSLDRINKVDIEHKTTSEPIKNLDNKVLDQHYIKTFGIFGGSVKETAILMFSDHRSQWVADEIWHQDQQGEWLKNGCYQLSIPYGNDLELIGDILKYGDQVEVLAPLELRSKLKQIAENLVNIYK